jgi:HPt (histidine-containing phosphotransfer) domain-containing protein
MSGTGDPSIDELLAQIRAQFAASLPSKIEAIEQLVARGAWDDARRAAHKLRGSAATHGHVDVGAAAAAIEDALLDAGDPPDAAVRTTVTTRLADARRALSEARDAGKESATPSRADPPEAR